MPQIGTSELKVEEGVDFDIWCIHSRGQNTRTRETIHEAAKNPWKEEEPRQTLVHWQEGDKCLFILPTQYSSLYGRARHTIHTLPANAVATNHDNDEGEISLVYRNIL